LIETTNDGPMILAAFTNAIGTWSGQRMVGYYVFGPRGKLAVFESFVRHRARSP